MGKSNKQENNPKRRVKVRVFNVLMILAGADLILLLSPGAGILNSLFSFPTSIHGRLSASAFCFCWSVCAICIGRSKGGLDCGKNWLPYIKSGIL